MGETSGWSRYGQGSYIPYIIVLGIGVTWHSHMSNASKGCHDITPRLVKLRKNTQTRRRCINAMWQYQIRCLHSCDVHHSVFSPKKWPSATPSKHMGQGGFEPAEGGRGGPSCEWFTSARNLRCDRSLPLAQDCPQYIPKGKPTPASKLAFVKRGRFLWSALRLPSRKPSVPQHHDYTDWPSGFFLAFYELGVSFSNRYRYTFPFLLTAPRRW